MERYLKVLKHEVNSKNGHIAVRVVPIEEDDNGNTRTGSEEIIGIDSEPLKRDHGDSIESFILSHKERLMKSLNITEDHHRQLNELKGKRL